MARDADEQSRFAAHNRLSWSNTNTCDDVPCVFLLWFHSAASPSPTHALSPSACAARALQASFTWCEGAPCPPPRAPPSTHEAKLVPLWQMRNAPLLSCTCSLRLWFLPAARLPDDISFSKLRLLISDSNDIQSWVSALRHSALLLAFLALG